MIAHRINWRLVNDWHPGETTRGRRNTNLLWSEKLEIVHLLVIVRCALLILLNDNQRSSTVGVLLAVASALSSVCFMQIFVFG